MAKMISISFKDNEEALYNYLKGKSSPSIYVKDILMKEMNNVNTTSQDKVIHHKVEEVKPNNTNLSSLIKAGR